ncbi:hypothetical protein D3227_03040 [Mesorhizobium waimense]|uniref:Uncharacterized protein n=1 Tax=Mesorhizobium waimense TaxID=1300307 RepID=A0A3A5L4Q2_9HYPH|nr:hypothetical protein D3227_03040 [Mesorhizobium waimense]
MIESPTRSWCLFLRNSRTENRYALFLELLGRKHSREEPATTRHAIRALVQQPERISPKQPLGRIFFQAEPNRHPATTAAALLLGGELPASA